MGKTIYAVALVGVLILMFSYLVSAGIGDWWAGITGRATSGEANATITLAGSNNVSIIIWNNTLTSISAVEDSVLRLQVNITVTDADGAADINDSSVDINVSSTGEPSKLNQSCMYNGQQTSTSRNYSCHFDMWFFDAAAFWTINATANDFGTGNYKYNASTFYYGSTQAIKLGPTSLTWAGLSPGQRNQTSTNDPLLINNTGNYMVQNLTVRGINLVGAADPSYVIDVRNFTADIETSGSCSGSNCVECIVDTSGVTMQNNTELRIVNANVTRGNYTIGDGNTGQDQIYFCMPLVPSNLVSQTYSTPDEWTFTIRAWG